jgi:polyisoprenoid-binding protein YceI
MPTFFRKLTLLSFALFAILSCKNDPKIEAAQISSKFDTIQLAPVSAEGAAIFKVTEGTVNWSGTHSIDKTGHQGTITLDGGALVVKQGQILSGNVTLDMNSTSVTDIKDPGERRDLESHLKDSDFFEVNKYPRAEFVIKKVLPSTMPNYNWVLSGKLTMKGKTAPVNIPVKVSIEGNVLHAESPAFPINRTTWGISFHSGILGTAKDKMIDDTVPISLKIVAKYLQPF